MKKSFFWKVLLVAAMSAPLFSCSDDDEPNVSGKKLPANQESVDVLADFKNSELAFVEGGSFLMGAQSESDSRPNYDASATENEGKVHQVSVSSFYIMKKEVTQAMWEYVVNDTPIDSLTEMEFNHPAVNLSYDAIVNVFIPRLNKITGIAYRLPTEAEWEYAARGGQKNAYTSSMGETGEYLRFSGSDDASEVVQEKEYFETLDTLGKVTKSWYGAGAVGKKAPNELGVYDMSGNVWEMCRDWHSTGYDDAAKINPQGAANGNKRIVRGGSWAHSKDQSRVSYRSAVEPDHACDHIGFRLVVSAE